MDKPWLLTRETFNDMRGDETALLYTSIQRILRAQHLKTLEWLMGIQVAPVETIRWHNILREARKDVEDG